MFGSLNHGHQAESSVSASGRRMIWPKTDLAHSDGRFGPGWFDPLQPTQADDSACLVKMQGCHVGWLGLLDASSKNLWTDDSTHIFWREAAYMQRAQNVVICGFFKCV